MVSSLGQVLTHVIKIPMKQWRIENKGYIEYYPEGACISIKLSTRHV